MNRHYMREYILYFGTTEETRQEELERLETVSDAALEAEYEALRNDMQGIGLPEPEYTDDPWDYGHIPC